MIGKVKVSPLSRKKLEIAIDIYNTVECFISGKRVR